MSIPYSILFHVLLDLVYVIYSHSSRFPCKNNDLSFTISIYTFPRLIFITPLTSEDGASKRTVAWTKYFCLDRMVAYAHMRLRLVRKSHTGMFLVYIVMKVYQFDHSTTLKLLPESQKDINQQKPGFLHHLLCPPSINFLPWSQRNRKIIYLMDFSDFV